MPKYVKKPVEIEAVQWTGQNKIEILEFCEKCFSKPIPGIDHSELIVSSLEGPMRASIGDYIIKGVKGEFYPCREDIFYITYDKVTN
jgi:hypothetical protein